MCGTAETSEVISCEVCKAPVCDVENNKYICEMAKNGTPGCSSVADEACQEGMCVCGMSSDSCEGSGDTSICDVDLNVCVECKQNSDCTEGGETTCNPKDGKCVECTEDDNCKDKECEVCMAATCDAATNICECDMVENGTPGCSSVTDEACQDGKCVCGTGSVSCEGINVAPLCYPDKSCCRSGDTCPSGNDSDCSRLPFEKCDAGSGLCLDPLLCK